MGWRQVVAAAAGALLLPGASAALDLGGALSTSAEWDSNVARVDAPGRTDDWVFRVTPTVQLIEDRGKARWRLSYRFPYEVAVKESEIDDFRHFVNANGQYVLSESTSFFLSNTFEKSEAVNNLRDFDTTQVPAIGTFREDVYVNRVSLSTRHLFTPRSEGIFSFRHRYFDSDLADRSRTNVFTGTGNLTYQLSPRHRVGGGTSATLQKFDENDIGTRAARQSFFLNTFATWIWLIDEVTTLELSGGPTFIDSQQNRPPQTLDVPLVPYVEVGDGVQPFNYATCGTVNNQTVLQRCALAPTVPNGPAADAIRNAGSALASFPSGAAPPGASDTSWTFFANTSLSRRWSPAHVSTLTYLRTEDTASGLDSSILDAVGFLHTWQISERWSSGLRADYTRRESTSPQDQTFLVVVPDPNGFAVPAQPAAELTSQRIETNLDTSRWGVGVFLDRQLTRHLRAGIRYSFNRQESGADTIGSLSDFDDHIITIGIQYDFDRYSLDRYLP
jgi:hypothetical protein